MTKYVVTGLSRVELQDAGIDINNIPISHSAYVIANKTVIEVSDNTHDICRWIADEHYVWIGKSLELLPESMHYSSDKELLENRNNIPFGELNEEEQEILREHGTDPEVGEVIVYGDKESLHISHRNYNHVCFNCDDYVYKIVTLSDIVKEFTT